MSWAPNMDPFGNLGLSALVAAIPILFLFYALAIQKMKGHTAAVLTIVLAVLVAILGYGMPAGLALSSTAYGALFGLFPIGWIVITAVFLYNMTVKTGQFEIIKGSIATLTEDRRLQALLIAFSFGAFLEGAAGFGTPVAITAAMLVGLGFEPLYAAGICLIANTAPVAFGAIGIPIITAGKVTGLDPMVISQMVGRQLPFLSVFVPFWLVFIMAGWKGAREVMPAILVSGVSFALSQYLTSNFHGPLLPDIISSLVSIICLALFLKVWKPKNVWRFPKEPPATLKFDKALLTPGNVLKAWSPFIVLVIMVGDWGIASVKQILDLVSIKIPWGTLNAAMQAGSNGNTSVVFTFNWLSAAGTSILIAGIISAFILRVRPGAFLSLFWETLYNLRFALLTIACVLGFAYVANHSGMTPTIGKALTVTGVIFPFFSAFLGWLGVFITGSDTSSNALFCKMQQITAQNMGLNETLTIATNSSGGVCGKMISPQSIAVGAASVGLIGREADIFRFTLKHSIFFTALLGALAMLQAYALKWMVPAPLKAAEAAAATAAKDFSGGIYTLIVTVVVILILGVFAARQGRSLQNLAG